MTAARFTRSGWSRHMRWESAGAAVVTGGEELAVAEIFHDFDLVLRHRPEKSN